MKKQFTPKGLIAMGAGLFAMAGAMTLNAQVATTYTFSQATGTYTALTGGTVIASTGLGNMDEDVITVPMPTFYFDGMPYNSVAVSTNGFITFGSYLPYYDWNPISGYEPYNGVVSAFAGDLNSAQAAAGTRNIQYGQVGTEFVVQWQNVRRYAVAGERISFQIRLNNANGEIKIVYGGSIIPGNDQYYPEVGLRGPDNNFATNVNNRRVQTGAWGSSTAGTDEYSTCTYDSNVPSAVPAVGTTFTWTPALDMIVTSLVSPGTSGCYGSNETVSVQIRNIGGTTINFATNPVTVTSSSTGTNPASFTPVTINTGTLAAYATQTVVVAASYDMSLAGQYSFEAAVSATGDVRTSNDAMATNYRDSHTPTVAMTSNFSMCPGGMVTLSANATAHDYDATFSNNTPVSIPDATPAGVNSTIVVSGQPVAASSVSVLIHNISHTYISDLTLKLTAPNGSSMILFYEAGSGDPDMIQTHFTATASTPIWMGTEPFTGDFLPEEPFSQLTGLANGTWTLNVADNYYYDVGTLMGWSIMIPVTNSVAGYAWTPSGDLSSATVSDPDAMPTATTTYTVVVTDISGCSNSGEVTVDVHALPTVTASVSAANVCENTNVTFTGGGADSYTWSGGVTDNVPFAVTATDTYTVTGTDVNGCTNTDEVTVNVNALPTVTASASATDVCENTAVTFTGGGADMYTWSGGVTDNVPFTVTATGTYTVTGVDVNGCEGMDVIMVTVNPLPVVTVSLPLDTICVSGGAITLSGESPAGGTWSGPGVSGNSFDPAVTGAGTFDIVYSYSDVNSCMAEDTAHIVVDVCLGVAEGNALASTIYPNPTGGVFTIELGQSPAAPVTVEVMNAIGQTIDAFTMNTTVKQVDLSQQEGGIYFVRIISGGTVSTIRVVKQ